MFEQVKQLIISDRRMIIEEFPQVVISHGSIHALLSDNLKIIRVSAKFALRLLNTDKMEFRKLTAVEHFLKHSRPDAASDNRYG